MSAAEIPVLAVSVTSVNRPSSSPAVGFSSSPSLTTPTSFYRCSLCILGFTASGYGSAGRNRVCLRYLLTEQHEFGPDQGGAYDLSSLKLATVHRMELTYKGFSPAVER